MVWLEYLLLLSESYRIFILTQTHTHSQPKQSTQEADKNIPNGQTVRLKPSTHEVAELNKEKGEKRKLLKK